VNKIYFFNKNKMSCQSTNNSGRTTVDFITNPPWPMQFYTTEQDKSIWSGTVSSDAVFWNSGMNVLDYYKNQNKMMVKNKDGIEDSNIALYKAPNWTITSFMEKEDGAYYPAVDRCGNCGTDSRFTGLVVGKNRDFAICGTPNFSCPTIGNTTPSPIPIRMTNGKFSNHYSDEHVDSLKCVYPSNAITNDTQYEALLRNITNGDYPIGNDNLFLDSYCFTTTDGINYPNLKSPYCVSYCQRHDNTGDSVDTRCKANDNLARQSCIGENLVSTSADPTGMCSKWCGTNSSNQLCLEARKTFCSEKIQKIKDMFTTIANIPVQFG
jgi:hypothetical protein